MTSASTQHVRAPRAWTGLVFVSLAGVLWGTIGPGVQLAHDASGLSPWVIGSYRSAAGMLVLISVALLMRRAQGLWRLGARNWRRSLAVGALTAAFQFFFFAAVLWAGVSVTTVVCLGFAPVLLLVVDSIRRRRLPHVGRSVTVVVALVGLLLVALAGGGVAAPPHPVLGILAALASGAAYALSTEFAGPLTQRLDTFTVTIVTLSIASALLIPAGLVLGMINREPLMTTSTAAWGAMVYLGVVTMAVAYALLYAGLRTTPSGTVVVATLLEPVAAVVIAVLFLGERLTAAGFIGTTLILLAIVTLGRQNSVPRSPVPDSPTTYDMTL